MHVKLLPALLCLSPIVCAQESPNGVSIKDISYRGPGCPPNTVGISLADDRKTFTMIFDEMVASSGPTVPAAENNKRCNIIMKIQYPQGWSYALTTIDYRGYVSIPEGVTAVHKSVHIFEDGDREILSQSPMKGPKDDDYLSRDTLKKENVVWSSCQKTKKMKIAVIVLLRGDTTKDALITLDSVDGKVEQQYGLSWKRC